jgi:hypothetical protein
LHIISLLFIFGYVTQSLPTTMFSGPNQSVAGGRFDEIRQVGRMEAFRGRSSANGPNSRSSEPLSPAAEVCGWVKGMLSL